MTIRFEERSTALFDFLKGVPLYGDKIISLIIEGDNSLMLYSVGEPVCGVLAVVRGNAVIATNNKEAAEELRFFLDFSGCCNSVVSDGSYFERSGDVFLLGRDFGKTVDVVVCEENADFSLFERVFELDFASLVNKKLCFYSAIIGGERVGGVAYERLYEETSIISMLCTDERYRRRGVATALLSHLYKEGERLYIMSKNKSSDDFYNRLGLQKFGEYYLYEQFL